MPARSRSTRTAALSVRSSGRSATLTLVRMPLGSPPDAATASSAMVDGGSTSPASVVSTVTTRASWPGVPEHARHLEARGQGPGLGPGVERGVGGEPQADDGLGVGVEDAQRLDVDLDPGEREQRPHVDDRAEAVAERTLRQVAGEPAPVPTGRPPHRRRARAVVEHEDVACPVGLEGQVESLGAEAPVGGVDDRVGDRRRRVGDDVEALAEERQQGGGIDALGQGEGVGRHLERHGPPSLPCSRSVPAHVPTPTDGRIWG